MKHRQCRPDRVPHDEFISLASSAGIGRIVGVAGLVVAASLAGCAAPALSLRPVPRRIALGTMPAVAPLRLVKSMPIVEARINGHGPYAFVVDTGATAVVISPRVARELPGVEIVTPRGTVSDAHGRSLRPRGVARDLTATVGDASFHEFDAVVLDLTRIQEHLDESVEGILGFSLFRGCTLTIDYAGEQLGLDTAALPPADGENVLPMRIEEDVYPTIDLAGDTGDIAVLLDTGSSFALTLREEDLATRRFSPAPSRSPGALALFGMGERGRHGTLRESLRLGGYELRFPPVLTSARNTIGGKILRHFAVRIDARNGRIRFARESRTPLRFRGNGMP